MRVRLPRNEYGVYVVPRGLEKRPASRKILSGQVHEPETLDFMRNHARDGDIVHAGTFFGDFIPALSSALAPGAMLWAFEPNPGSFQAAQATVRLNKATNVTLRNVALSNSPDQLLFRTHSKRGKPLGGVSRHVTEAGPGVEKVRSVMLDYAVPLSRKVTILQLDVEGHERQALKGAYHLIHRWRPILVLEYFDDLRWINRTFRGLGYVPRGKVHGNVIYAPEGVEVTLKGTSGLC